MKISILVPKMTKAKKKLPSLNVALAPERHIGAHSVPSEAQERPKSSQHISQNVKKSISKNMSFLDLFFSMFGEVSGSVCDEFLKPKRVQTANDNNFKNAIKTSPMATKIKDWP